MKRKKRILFIIAIIVILSILLSVGFKSFAAPSVNANVGDRLTVSYWDLKNNSNLYCIDKGGHLYSSGHTYTVAKKGTINTSNSSTSQIAKKLAYILSYDNSRYRTGAKGCEDKDPAQQALWTLLYENKAGVATALGLTNNDMTGGYAKWLTGTNLGHNTIYNSATDFATYTPSTPTINVTEDYKQHPTYNNNGALTGNYATIKFKVNYSKSNSGDFGGIEQIHIRNGENDKIIQTLKGNNIPASNTECTFRWGDKNTTYPSSVYIDVEYKKTVITAKYVVLYRKEDDQIQTLLYTSTEINNSSSHVKSKAIDGDCNVSLQKSIAAVFDSVTYSWDSNNIDSKRRGQKANMSSDLYQDQIVDPKGKWPQYASSDSSWYKDENPVKIKKGNYVIYRIDVYNNGTSDATIIKIRDRIPDQGTIKEITIQDFQDQDEDDGTYYRTAIYQNGETYGMSDDDDGFKFIENTNNKKIQYTIGELKANKRYIIYVGVVFDEDSTRVLQNRAWIFSTKQNNTSIYRQSDSDYVAFEKHSVSLEKYITSAGGSSYSRSGNPIYNEDIQDSSAGTPSVSNPIMKNRTKYDNPVLVESGDSVTYSIKVTNTGDSNIKVKTVKDQLPSELTLTGCSCAQASSITKNSNTGEITFTLNSLNGVKLTPGNSLWIVLTCKIETKENNKLIENYAHIDEIYDEFGNKVDDTDSWENNYDKDWIKTKQYNVKLEKYIYKTGTVTSAIVSGTPSSYEPNRSGHPEYGTHPGTSTRTDSYKYNNPVTLSTSYIAQYAIKVTNEGSTQVLINEIKDVLPTGLQYAGEISGAIIGSNDRGRKAINVDYNASNGIIEIKNNVREENILLQQNEYIKIYMMVRVTEPNISLNVIKNTAEINKISNKNGYEVNDSCTNDNKDSDYIQLGDITIKGTVWNDKVFDKKQDNYNGLYDKEQENPLQGITVYLYRNGKGIVSETTTNADGIYVFSNRETRNADGIVAPAMTWKSSVPNNERYIKAPRNLSNDRWNDAKTYYAYYIMFEYDGVTYTSTPDGKSYVKVDTNLPSNYQIDSNAREKLNSTEAFDGYVQNDRTSFNNKVNPVNNGSIIKYTTENKEGYIPKSTYDYNATNKITNMNMYSSTNLIDLEKLTKNKNNNELLNLEEQLKYVNLGLRGRDIFDLELKSDVASIDVKVNGQTGTYNYTNKVTVRRTDLTRNDYDCEEDMAHTYSAKSDYIGDSQTQSIRNSDLSNSKYNQSQLLQSIKVTYKITVTNASQTDGTATKVIDYYDDNYTFEKAYIGDYEATIENRKAEYGSSNSEYGYNSVIITTSATNITQTDPMEIYVVYELKNDNKTALQILGDLATGKKNSIATYNMAEIYEYKTQCAEGQTEFTRGLIDKDSAPGSVSTERTNLTNGTQIPNLPTIKYYFGKKQSENIDLSILKYEDDTYATPTLIFASSNSKRKIEGTVFEDYTEIKNDRIKTGDGKQTGDEPGIKGVKVVLFEIMPNDFEHMYRRYITYTDEKGNFEFNGFLPGNYLIEYYYGVLETDEEGNTIADTFTYDNNPNIKSYNGEDFQATNNTGKYVDEKLYGLEGNDVLWYTYNESKGISTGIDDAGRRKTVSTNVTGFNDYEMTVLNNVRDGKSKENAKVNYTEDETEKTVTVDDIVDKTNMNAYTPIMQLTVEQTVELNKLQNSKKLIEDKIIEDKGNGLGEWTVFPDKDRDYYQSYHVKEINFGIAEVPVTTVDLQKHVVGFTIKDSAGDNIIASLRKEGNDWKTTGDILPLEGSIFDVSIEDAKLQGAKLEVTYDITLDLNIEKNFDGNNSTTAPIIGLIDYIDNDLSYNATLGNNNNNWEVISYNDIQNKFREAEKSKDYNTIRQLKNLGIDQDGKRQYSTLDPEGKKYTTVVIAKEGNPLLNYNGEGPTRSCQITLEKILSATDSSLGNIITSSIESFEYDNNIEITGLDYENTKSSKTGDFIYRDRVRRPDRYIILTGIQHDTATSETIAIHPPTGENNNMIYYIIATISLGVLATGIVLIKKYAIKKN